VERVEIGITMRDMNQTVSQVPDDFEDRDVLQPIGKDEDDDTAGDRGKEPIPTTAAGDVSESAERDQERAVRRHERVGVDLVAAENVREIQFAGVGIVRGIENPGELWFRPRQLQLKNWCLTDRLEGKCLSCRSVRKRVVRSEEDLRDDRDTDKEHA